MQRVQRSCGHILWPHAAGHLDSPMLVEVGHMATVRPVCAVKNSPRIVWDVHLRGILISGEATHLVGFGAGWTQLQLGL